MVGCRVLSEEERNMHINLDGVTDHLADMVLAAVPAICYIAFAIVIAIGVLEAFVRHIDSTKSNNK